MKKGWINLVLMFLVISILSSFVLSVESNLEVISGRATFSGISIFDETFGALGLNDIGGIYGKYYPIIDFIIFFIIFYGIAQSAFGSRFGKKSNMVAGALGFGLAMALAFYESRIGNSIFGLLSPWILVLFVVIFGYLVYHIMHRLSRGTGGTINAALVAYAISFLALITLVGNDINTFRDSLGVFWSILLLIFAIALIALMVNIFRLVGRLFTGRGGGGGAGGGGFFNRFNPFRGRGQQQPQTTTQQPAPQQATPQAQQAPQQQVTAQQVKQQLLQNYYMPLDAAHQQIMQQISSVNINTPNLNLNMNDLNNKLKIIENNSRSIIANLGNSGLVGSVVNQVISLARSINTSSNNILRIKDPKQLVISYQRGRNMQAWIQNLGISINNL